jgi:heme A synthase
MKAQTVFPTILAKAALAAVAFGGFLVLAGAPTARANDWNDCRHRYVDSNWRCQHNEARKRAAFERRQWLEHHRYGWISR